MAAFSMLRTTKFASEDFVVDRFVPPENVLSGTMHIAVTLKLHCHPLNSIKLFYCILV
jgi:hypothetical protein